MTESDLHAMGMESRTAWELMPELCKALNLPYPPKPATPTNRDAMPDPFKETANV
jgi:hypothetical protein